jgi:hypothetical protein
MRCLRQVRARGQDHPTGNQVTCIYTSSDRRFTPPGTLDSLRRLDPDLSAAADDVGAAHGWPGGWLNAHAAWFAPAT